MRICFVSLIFTETGLGALGLVQGFPTENQFQITNETQVTLCHGSDSTESLIVSFLWGSGMCLVCGSAITTDVFGDITQVRLDL